MLPARVVFEWNEMKGGGHERSRKTRTVRTTAEDLRSRGAACGQAIRLFQFLDLVVLHCPADCLRRVSRRHVQSGGGDDADSCHHDAHTSIDDGSVNSLSDSHFGSSPFPGGSTLESVQSIVLGDSFSPAIIGSAPLLGTVGSPSNDAVGGIAPIEA